MAGQVTAQTFTVLHSFTPLVVSFPAWTNSDGAFPDCPLILSGNVLFGEAPTGGSLGTGNGTVFAVNTDGTGFKILQHVCWFSRRRS